MRTLIAVAVACLLAAPAVGHAYGTAQCHEVCGRSTVSVSPARSSVPVGGSVALTCRFIDTDGPGCGPSTYALYFEIGTSRTGSHALLDASCADNGVADYSTQYIEADSGEAYDFPCEVRFDPEFPAGGWVAVFTATGYTPYGYEDASARAFVTVTP